MSYRQSDTYNSIQPRSNEVGEMILGVFGCLGMVVMLLGFLIAIKTLWNILLS